MCGHQTTSPDSKRRIPRLQNTDSPLRSLLAAFGPHGTAEGGDGRDIDHSEDFFVCGHRNSDIQHPESTVIIFCNGFVHASKDRSRFRADDQWGANLLPVEFGGKAGKGQTIIGYADGHSKIWSGDFRKFLVDFGITEPRLQGIKVILPRLPNKLSRQSTVIRKPGKAALKSRHESR